MSKPIVMSKRAYYVTWTVLIGCVVIFAFIALYSIFILNPTVGYRLRQQTINAAANQAKLQANQLATVGPPATEISKGQAKAANSPTSPAPVYVTITGPVGHTGPQGPGPSSAQIAEAVSNYFAKHPPKATATVAQLTPIVKTYVANYLTEHPPASGRPGKNGANGASGSPGAEGSPGPGPTQDEIAAAVSAYLIANPPPSGPPGPPGQNGQDGKDGQNGQDGKDGKDGSNGSPPVGWSYTDPNGTSYTCSRNNADDSSPTYTCAPTNTESPSVIPTIP